MSEQPQKTNRNWEEILTRLLQKYAKSLIEMDGEPVGAAQSRADIRMRIIAIGRTFDELVDECSMNSHSNARCACHAVNRLERDDHINYLTKLDKCEGDKS